MISSLKKRIVFCGNYRWWYPEWRHLDEPNDMDYHEFFGGKYMNSFIFGKTNECSDSEIALNRMKMNRVIDSSEYVIRCDFGKTSNPTSGFEINGHPSTCFGDKTDIVSFWINFLRANNTDDMKLNSTPRRNGMLQNHFNDISVRFGIPSNIGDLSLNKYMANNEIGDVFKTILEYYSSKMLGSRNDETMKKESWFNMNHFYYRYLSGHEHDRYPDSHVFFDKMNDKFKLASEYMEDVYGTNIKFSSLDSYIDLCDNVSSCSISYTELKELISGDKWSERILEFNIDDKWKSEGWMETEEQRSVWMDWVKDNYHVQRGTETIWMMINDDRFRDYDKYIVGTMGINECFRIGSDCNINQWGEYLFLSKCIKDKKIKYLPSYVDKLYDDYHSNVMSSNFNLVSI